MTDISAILMLGAGSDHARTSLTSLYAACAQARAHGISVELILAVGNRAAIDPALLDSSNGLVVIDTPDEAPAVARNVAVAAARGTFLSFLEVGDCWGAGWLHAAFAAATANTRRIVWHPEATLHGAGDRPAWAIQPDIETSHGDWVTLAMRDHWASSSFAARSLHLEVPYRSFDWAWVWNADAVAAGCLHRPVEGTAHLTSRPAPSDHLAPAAAELWRQRVGWGQKVGLLGKAAP